MTMTLATPTAPRAIAHEPEQRFDLNVNDWGRYLAISGALNDWAGVRLAFLDGELTLLGTSQRHEWLAECLGMLVSVVAARCGISCEPAGHATLRRKDRGAGVEGDKTFFLGRNADAMLGVKNLDLDVHPPPDLAIEVELTHPADKVMIIYGRLGIPEVWRLDVDSRTLRIWALGDSGGYSEASRSPSLRVIEPADILAQLTLAEEIGFSRWSVQLHDWVRDVIIPRLGNGA